jgi:hypothetical protein
MPSNPKFKPESTTDEEQISNNQPPPPRQQINPNQKNGGDQPEIEVNDLQANPVPDSEEAKKEAWTNFKEDYPELAAFSGLHELWYETGADDIDNKQLNDYAPILIKDKQCLGLGVNAVKREWLNGERGWFGYGGNTLKMLGEDLHLRRPPHFGYKYKIIPAQDYFNNFTLRTAQFMGLRHSDGPKDKSSPADYVYANVVSAEIAGGWAATGLHKSLKWARLGGLPFVGSSITGVLKQPFNNAFINSRTFINGTALSNRLGNPDIGAITGPLANMDLGHFFIATAAWLATPVIVQGLHRLIIAPTFNGLAYLVEKLAEKMTGDTKGSRILNRFVKILKAAAGRQVLAITSLMSVMMSIFSDSVLAQEYHGKLFTEASDYLEVLGTQAKYLLPYMAGIFALASFVTSFDWSTVYAPEHKKNKADVVKKMGMLGRNVNHVSNEEKQKAKTANEERTTRDKMNAVLNNTPPKKGKTDGVLAEKWLQGEIVRLLDQMTKLSAIWLALETTENGVVSDKAKTAREFFYIANHQAAQYLTMLSKLQCAAGLCQTCKQLPFAHQSPWAIFFQRWTSPMVKSISMMYFGSEFASKEALAWVRNWTVWAGWGTVLGLGTVVGLARIYALGLPSWLQDAPVIGGAIRLLSPAEMRKILNEQKEPIARITWGILIMFLLKTGFFAKAFGPVLGGLAAMLLLVGGSFGWVKLNNKLCNHILEKFRVGGLRAVRIIIRLISEVILAHILMSSFVAAYGIKNLGALIFTEVLMPIFCAYGAERAFNHFEKKGMDATFKKNNPEAYKFARCFVSSTGVVQHENVVNWFFGRSKDAPSNPLIARMRLLGVKKLLATFSQSKNAQEAFVQEAMARVEGELSQNKAVLEEQPHSEPPAKAAWFGCCCRRARKSGLTLIKNPSNESLVLSDGNDANYGTI